MAPTLPGRGPAAVPSLGVYQGRGEWLTNRLVCSSPKHQDTCHASKELSLGSIQVLEKEVVQKVGSEGVWKSQGGS